MYLPLKTTFLSASLAFEVFWFSCFMTKCRQSIEFLLWRMNRIQNDLQNPTSPTGSLMDQPSKRKYDTRSTHRFVKTIHWVWNFHFCSWPVRLQITWSAIHIAHKSHKTKYIRGYLIFFSWQYPCVSLNLAAASLSMSSKLMLHIPLSKSWKSEFFFFTQTTKQSLIYSGPYTVNYTKYRIKVNEILVLLFMNAKIIMLWDKTTAKYPFYLSILKCLGNLFIYG